MPFDSAPRGSRDGRPGALAFLEPRPSFPGDGLRVSIDACIVRYMTEQEIRAELQRYADMRRDRDPLVRRALAAGVTKKEIHELSGMSRSTIDRIAPEPTAEDHAS